MSKSFKQKTPKNTSYKRRPIHTLDNHNIFNQLFQFHVFILLVTSHMPNNTHELQLISSKRHHHWLKGTSPCIKMARCKSSSPTNHQTMTNLV